MTPFNISQKIKRSDYLGRYYTNADISTFLVSEMHHISPRRVLDLGAGMGSLSHAALRHWKNIELVTVDVDAEVNMHLGLISQENPGTTHSHVRADVLSSKLTKIVNSQFDAAICNPPFIIPEWRKGFAEILEDAGLSGCISVLSKVDAALIFLAQNFRILSNDSTLGIIVPDSLISASRYKEFRRILLGTYTVRKVIRLPSTSFKGTDAQAHILIIQKCRPLGNEVILEALGHSHSLSVNSDEGTDRLDFKYHFEKRNLNETCLNVDLFPKSLVSVNRGSFTSAEIKLSKFPILHTSDICDRMRGTWCDLSYFGADIPNFSSRKVISAKPGDILLARVGRNLEKKVLGVLYGYPVLSDCIYRITPPEGKGDAMLKRLSSEEGQNWLRSRCYGVSAQQLTKADLITFPF
jgi:type I restriction enzyme M protein